MDNDRKQAEIYWSKKGKRLAIVKKLHPNVIPKIVDKPNGSAKRAKSQIKAKGEIMGKEFAEFEYREPATSYLAIKIKSHRIKWEAEQDGLRKLVLSGSKKVEIRVFIRSRQKIIARDA